MFLSGVGEGSPQKVYRVAVGIGVAIVFLISLLMHFSLSVLALASSAPTDLQATAGYDEVALSWTAPVDDGGSAITDYTIEYSAGGANTWSTFDDGVSTDTTATVTGLVGDAAYDFRVSAINEDGTSDPSTTATATALNPAPAAPTDLGVVTGDGQVSLSWTPAGWTGSSAVIDYVVEYSVSGENSWTMFSDGVSSDPSAVVTGLTNGAAYDFRVSAVNDTEVSVPSDSQTATPRTVPGAPTGVNAVRSNGQATVSFTSPASNGGAAITGYMVTSNPGGITASGSDSPITVTGLTNGTAYTFTVVAINVAGDSAASAASNSVTPATVPDAPTSVVGTPGDGQASVAFTAPVNTGGAAVTSYTVTSNPGGITATGSASPIVVPGLANGTTYSFTVTASNAMGEGASSSASDDVTPRTTPGAPTGASAVRDNGQATISFTAPASNGGAAITSYTVTSNPGNVTASGSTSPITVTGLTNGAAYTFTVTATNAAGTGAASTATSSVTPATTPGAPTGLTATSGAKKIDLSWAAPASNGATITDYIVEYSVAGANSWQVFADGVSAATTASVTGLQDGTNYDVRVAAINDVGQSSYATSSTSTYNVAGAPTAVSGTPGNGQVTVSFTPPASDGGTAITSYTVTSNPGNITATGGSSPIAVTGLTNGVAYTFTVTATNSIGSSVASAASGSVTPRTTPDAPTGLGVTPGNAQAALSWTAPASNGGSAITDYVVQYKLAADSSWTTFADTTSTATIATVTGLTNGAAYDFRVAAVNIAGTGANSAAASTTPRTNPDAPTAVSAVRGNGQAVVSFTPPASDGGAMITNYTVTSNPGNFTASGSTSPITVTGLTNGTSYTFTVIATNAAGSSVASAASSGVVPATVPGAPTAVSGTPGNGQAVVSFTPPASNGGSAVTGYTVTSSPGGVTASGSTSPVTVIGLTNGTAYTFTVVATNDVGASTASAASASVTPRTVPGAPTNVSATAGNAEAVVSFTAPASNGGSAITNYTVTSSPSGITATGGSSPITVPGLTNGTAYTFTVVATNAAGSGAASTASNSVEPASVPSAPTGLSVTPGDGQVAMSWTAPASNGGAITDYVLQRKLTTDSTWITIDDGVSTATTATVTGLVNGTAYDFRVAAVNSIGTGIYSSAVNSTPRTIPGAPTAVTATPGNTQVALSWTASTFDGGSSVTDYTVQYSPAGQNNWTTFPDGTSTATTATVTGLTNGTTYDFRIAAVNVAGVGAYSVTASSMPRTVPSAPTAASAVRGNGQAVVSFTPSASNGGSSITGYTVTSNPGNITATGTTSPITVTGLTNGTAYTFTVVATNIAGNSTASAASSSVTPATVPGAPTALTPTAGVSQVSLSWTVPASNGGLAITDYIIEYKVATDSAWTVFSDGVSTATSATITGLTNSTAYNFRIAAVNGVDAGNYSNIATSTPRTVPGAPTGLQAAVGSKQIALSWTAPASNGGSAITDYVVQYSPAGQNNWTTFPDGTSAATSATVTGLTNETAYDFRVAAVNVAGTGTASSIVTATPEPAPVVISDIKASATNTSATITWTTDTASDSKVEYGLDTNYGNVTTVSETDGVVNHSVTLSGLQTCTIYHFRVISQPTDDSDGATSGNTTVATTGCVGGTTVVGQEVAAVPSASGGAVTLTNGDRDITVSLPENYTDSDTTVQVKKLSGTPTATTGLPAKGLVEIAGQVYDIKAVLANNSLVTEFDQPITITVHYTDSDIAGIDESSLRIYNWHNSSWKALSDCTVDQTANTVICTTTQFSLFALFGQSVPVNDSTTKDGTKASGTTNGNRTTDDTPVANDASNDSPSENGTDIKQPNAGTDKEAVDQGGSDNDIWLWWWVIAGVAISIMITVAVKQHRRGQKWQ